MKCATEDCPNRARKIVQGGELVAVLCMRCWRALLERIAESAGLRVRQLGPGWAT